MLIYYSPKFYIGENAAVFGSANLSKNGLSEKGLFELCAEVIEVEILEKLNANFEKVKLLAIKQYPTTEHKKKQIKELKTLTRKGHVAGINKVVEQKYLSFEDFDPSVEDDFYIAWYQPEDVAYSDDVEICKNADIFGNDVHFLPNDDVTKNKWVLLWRITNDNKLDARTKPVWVFIHEIFENGVAGLITDSNGIEEYSYSKLAFQRKDWAVLSDPPFKLTDEIVKAFRAVVQEPSPEKYLIQESSELFSLNEAKKGFVLFIEAMKKHLNK